jgi:protein AFG1
MTMIRPALTLFGPSSSVPVPQPFRNMQYQSARLFSSSSKDPTDGPLHEAYRKLLAEKDILADPHQLAALPALERLRNELLRTSPSDVIIDVDSSASSSDDDGLFGNWFGSAAQQVNEAVSSLTRTKHPRGVYLHGGVGCGKTFLMNLFYDSLTDENCPQWNAVKRKVHFNKFMLGIHKEMHVVRSSGAATGSDAILPAVIRQTAAKGRLICFDEFQVTDVADALILQRLFTGLWQHGCVVVATSNRAPDELYMNGLQRDRFVPFIDVINKECKVVSMWESETDYRLVQKMQTKNAVQVYFIGRDQYRAFDKLFYEIAGGSALAPTSLKTQGRRVTIPLSSVSKCIARFSFDDLCAKALGAADYLVIGQQFHTVFVDRVPVLTLNQINWVRRFITFVDIMYECNVKLIIQAKTDVHGIFLPDKGAQQPDEVFSFDRTVSRLDEMGSQKYLQKRWARSRTAESKAALLSQQKATVQYDPSLGDVSSPGGSTASSSSWSSASSTSSS